MRALDILKRNSHMTRRPMLALERNIVKFRSMEMMVFIYEAEQLRKFILSCIDNGHMFAGTENPLKKPGKQFYEILWGIIEDNDILPRHEIEQLVSLLQYRNDIAHRVDELLIDINSDNIHFQEIKYDYTALTEMYKLKDKVETNMAKKYPMTANLNAHTLEPIIDTLKQELARLSKRINRQLVSRIANFLKRKT